MSLLVFVFAFIPRYTTHPTPTFDEFSNWQRRTLEFRDALAAGNWAGTLIAYHPGVITLWLGALGHNIADVLYGPEIRQTDFALYTTTIRIPMAVFHSLGIVAAFWLIRKLLGTETALIATIFLSVEPFLVGHSQILHTDAPVTILSFLMLLCSAIALRLDEAHSRDSGPLRWHWWLLAGVLYGLTVLAKINGAVMVVGVTGTLLYVRRQVWRTPRQWWNSWILPMLVFGCAAAGTAFALYPAAWEDLPAVLDRTINFSSELAAFGHVTLYRGLSTNNPPADFYLLNTAYRLSPWVALGLPLAVLAWFSLSRPRRIVWGQHFLVIVVMLVFLSLQAKKFDRYILPIYPLLIVLAAGGYAHLLNRISFSRGLLLARAVITVATIALFVHVMALMPHPLYYYSPLAGGLRGAQNDVLVGWGEGLDYAGKALLDLMGSDCETPVLSVYAALVRPFSGCLQIVDMYMPEWETIVAEAGPNSYSVFYINFLQRQQRMQIPPDIEPVFSYVIDGVTLVSIYRTLDVAEQLMQRAPPQT